MRLIVYSAMGKPCDLNTSTFRERLTQAGAIERLFDRFDVALRETGYIPMSGQLVDASLIKAPKQRNTDAEKQAIKDGKIADEIWSDQPAKAVQIGERVNAIGPREPANDARWTVQFGKARARPDGTMHPDVAIPTFGYKTHTSIDKRYRLIRRWDVTSAARHDGLLLRRGLLDATNTGSCVWADSAYRSRKNEAFMDKHGFTSHVHHKKPRGKPIPAHIRRGNATRSKHRAPIEHVYAVHKGPMDLTIRTIGIVRAKTKIGIANIAYNIRRLVQIRRAGVA